MKTLEVIKKILKEHKEELREKYKAKGISIFGSYVRGEQKEISDIDMLVEFEEPISLLWLVKVENYLSDLLGIKVDLVPKKDLREEIRDEVLEQEVAI